MKSLHDETDFKIHSTEVAILKQKKSTIVEMMKKYGDKYEKV